MAWADHPGSAGNTAGEFDPQRHLSEGGGSLNATALIWSKAPVIIGAHNAGPLTRPATASGWPYRPIPPENPCAAGGSHPASGSAGPASDCALAYRRRGPSLLVAEGGLNTKGRAVVSTSKTGRGRTTVPIFLLVPQVRLPKRQDLARDAERAADAVPGRIVGKWLEGESEIVCVRVLQPKLCNRISLHLP